jgi:hypothetical protein
MLMIPFRYEAHRYLPKLIVGLAVVTLRLSRLEKLATRIPN